MAADFPHLRDTEFPGIANVDVYAYENEFDYRRWDADVRMRLYRVPWDGTNDVPGFETDEARDAWFDSQAGHAVTLASALHVMPDGTVPLPLPFDMACRYNYVVVEFPIATSATEPIGHEGANGCRRWHYFMRAVEQRSASCTLCEVTLDDWTTFSNSCEFGYMMLERGHAPMAASSVDSYLSNPLANSRYLLAPDVSFGGRALVSASNDVVLNDGEMWACIVTDANPRASWGTKAEGSWTTPAPSWNETQGMLAPFAFAVPATSLGLLLAAIDADVPQFKRTVRCVFMASEKLLSLGEAFAFAGVECRDVTATERTFPLIDLEAGMFGYPAEYAGIAKLYTYPYAHVEVADESGNVTIVHVEDTTGSLDLTASISLAFPFVGIDAAVIGVGSAYARSIGFSNLTERSMTACGMWYEALMHWDVPTFEVTQRASVANDYATHFDRAQAVTAYEASYSNAVASADAGKANAYASADASVANVANSGAAQVNNTEIAVTASAANVARSNEASTTITGIGNSTNQAAQAYDAGLQRGVQEADANAVAATTLINAAATIGESLATGNPAAIAGGVLSAATAGVNAAVMLNANKEKVELSITNSQNKVTSQNNSNTYITAESTDTQTDNITTSNDATTRQTANAVNAANVNAANSANVAKSNATRSRDTSVANAGRSRDVAESAVSNSIAQAGLRAPLAFGSASGTSSTVTRPMLASANVVTQSRSAIAQAGDAMLRYGYALGMQWMPEKLAVMPKFTYWKASRANVLPGNGVMEESRERIARLLENGVTVWTRPEYIGRTSIYDNV